MQILRTTVSYLIILALTLSGANLFGQSFEFTQNKGQWNPEVMFKGELMAGAFFLKVNGYRVLQHQQDDLAAVKAIMTGHEYLDEEGKRALAQRAAKQGTTDPGTSGGSAGEEVLTLRSHAYDVRFVGANDKPRTLLQQEMPGYANYFIGNDPSKWVGEVKSFATVVYENMYPGIDVRYYSENGYLKYDLLVHPNAPLEKLVMEYVGVDKLSIRDNKLVIKTSVSEVTEDEPYSYQLVNGQRQSVNCKYEIYDNKVRFKLSGYDRSKMLVIDPTLIFASFVGSPADTWGYTATYDRLGNLYAGGIVFGSGYPVTPGAFQTSYRGGLNTGESGGFDMGIMKFSSNGRQRMYATYLGGAVGNEQPHSLVVDNAGNLVIAGRTTSTDYPTTIPTIGTGGSWDIVVTKLNATGSLLVGSIRMGGSNDDGVNIKHKYSGTGAAPVSLQQNYGDDARSEVIIDGAGNILVASCSRSINFPVTAGAIQSTLRGQQDALVLRFNPNLNGVQFATFLGGSGDDAAYVLSIGPNGNIYAAGGTTSDDFPGNKAGTVGSAFNGGLCDGFIAELSATGTTLVKSCYIGTAGTDQVYGIQFDRLGFVYFMGTSTGNYPVQNAGFSQTGGKQFIGKLQNDLSAFVYSTVFGTNASVPNISPIAFLVDRCENVYVSGWGGRVVQYPNLPVFPSAGTTGLTITSDAIQNVTDGKDFYFFVLEKDATSQLFGSFFGQQDAPGVNSTDHVDGGTSRFDSEGIIYQAICANCQGGQFPTTPGVVGPTNPSGRCNEAVVKIAFDLGGVRGKVKSSIDGIEGDTAGCVPLQVAFRDTIAIAKSYEWDFGDGSAPIRTTTPDANHLFNAVGTYRVRLISVDSTKCYPRDTSFINIIVSQDKVPTLAAATKLPPCQSNTYRFDNLSTPVPGKPFTNTSFRWDFGDGTALLPAGTSSVQHQYPGPGTYDVKLILVDTNFCNAPDTFLLTLRVSPLVDASFDVPGPACAPFDAQFVNTSLGGTDFFWDFGDGTTSIDPNPVKFYPNPGVYTVKLVAVDTNTCNLIDSTISNVVVSGKPRVDFTFSPNPPEENIITTFTNTSDIVPRYEWIFGDGNSLITLRRDTIVRHQYPQTGTYNACLVGINDLGCADTVCYPVDVIINPILDVVSAFTPNDDGVNDRAVVIGYGLQKLTFRIYNRWGQLMFETNDVSQGWDGKFKGKPQPMDAYGYTLDAQFVSGETVKKSGNITLIR